jgi:hypothetical protein
LISPNALGTSVAKNWKGAHVAGLAEAGPGSGDPGGNQTVPPEVGGRHAGCSICCADYFSAFFERFARTLVYPRVVSTVRKDGECL